jgi:hypothetical protein
MILSDTGESRVRGYLFVLERSLRAAVAPQLAADAVREVESHIRERVAESQGLPNERDALEGILVRLGTPTTVARAYSLEMMIDEASTGGRFASMFRTLVHLAGTGGRGFLGTVLLLFGYGVAFALVSMAFLKPVFPGNVGFWIRSGRGITLGFQVPAPQEPELLGYWIIPLALSGGIAILVTTHRAARRWVEKLRPQRVGLGTR